jgi:fructose-1,6-bisphosphatase I
MTPIRDPDRSPADIVTVQQHILQQQRVHPTATGEFSWLLSGITFATRVVAAQVRRAGLVHVLGAVGEFNIHGEEVQKLDVVADRSMTRYLSYREVVGILASEEQDEPVVLKDDATTAKYIVVYDPLDGSSNIDVNVSVGTIFSILRRATPPEPKRSVMEDLLQPGTQQLAAGYVVYGSSTVLTYTTGQGVHMFTLDPMVGAYVLCQENVRMPEEGRIYSVNEANFDSFPKGVQEYLAWAKTKEAGPYTSRYIGSLVADFHRTLLRGGVFLYPPTAKAPEGKLRLMYEANPMGFLAEQAGGVASDGKMRILDKQPKSLHERTPLIIGAKRDVDRVLTRLSR